MGIFFVYILKSSVCLTIFYLFYKLLLSRDTFHRFNRIALLSLIMLSVIIVRGIYGLPFLSNIETEKLPELSGAGRTGLHRIELRIECKQGSLSVGQLRTHPLFF